MNQPSDRRELDARTVELETLITHLQRNVDELNSVVIDQKKRRCDLVNRIQRLEDKLRQLVDSSSAQDWSDA